ncbi:hypothetical protein PQX77_006217 [Marasmius sp. AFHP31]|nr:hypothetical protein PQX77_006217 [Marasmius sp. AFHP31]
MSLETRKNLPRSRTITQIDDRDPQLVFTPNGAWKPGGTEDEYMETTMGTTTAGARMSFNFTGTGIEVFGTLYNDIRDSAVINMFTIDGGTSVQWSQRPVLGLPTQYKAKMFSTRGLEDGAHNLVMEVTMKDSATYIDYLEVDTSVGGSISLPPGVPTTLSQQITSSTISLSASTSLPTPTSITAPTVTPGTDAGSVLSRGAVAGITIGAMTGVFLMLLFIGWGLRRRWRRSQERSRETEAAQSDQVNGILVPQRSIDTLLNSQARPFLLFASTVEKSRNRGKQSPSSGGASRPIGECGPGHPESSVLSLDDPPPSYASQPS